MGLPRHILTLAHSPDSDDMVMWWPLTGMIGPGGEPVAGTDGEPAVDTGRFRFRCIADDIERLNRRAIERGDLDITAISAHTYPHVKDRYAITACGASLGEGYGPKVVVRADSPVRSLSDAFRSNGHPSRVAVPGVHTTAFLTLRILAGRDFDHEPMLFSEVIDAVASGACDAGLLIHEAQLAVEAAGLRPIADLGRAWLDRRGLPLPLGLNVIKRDLDDRFGPGTVRAVADTLERSILHARGNADKSRRFLRLHGADRPEWNDDDLLDRYMAMYVNDSTSDMGDRGRSAIRALLTEAHEAGLCPHPGEVDVVAGAAP